jgi:G3E family GTPase
VTIVASPAVIPVTIIGGYLGAGKTTLINRLLRQADGERIAVLVNDFGDINIDADLIEARDDDLISIAGGCVCCSFGSDLLDALTRVVAMQPAPERILIETSGVALPRSIARTLTLMRGVATEAVIVVADAQSLRERAADRYVGDTVRTQLREADLVLLGKTDLVEATAIAGLRAWLTEFAPQAACLQMQHGRIERALLFGNFAGSGPLAPARTGISPSTSHVAATMFASLSVLFTQPVRIDEITSVLTDPALGVARAKGLIAAKDGGRWLLQQVGRRLEVRALDDASDNEPGRLVMIGVRAELDVATLDARLASLGAMRAPPG